MVEEDARGGEMVGEMPGAACYYCVLHNAFNRQGQDIERAPFRFRFARQLFPPPPEGEAYLDTRGRDGLFQQEFNFSKFYFPVKNTGDELPFKNANRNIRLAPSVDPRI